MTKGRYLSHNSVKVGRDVYEIGDMNVSLHAYILSDCYVGVDRNADIYLPSNTELCQRLGLRTTEAECG